MTLNLMMGMVILSGALSLGLIDKALSPDLGRFPCANRYVRWAIRVYVLGLAYRGFEVAIDPTIEMRIGFIVAANLMALAHGALLFSLLRAKLPDGIWARLDRRRAMVAKLVHDGGKHGTVLAKLAADGATVAPPDAGPNEIVRL